MTVTAVNQLWVADITYIHLRTEFVLLAVVIDRCSRKAIGWALDRSPTARVAVTALEQAIGQRQPPPGVVHHSDRGTQYASAEYASSWRAHRQEGWCCWGLRASSDAVEHRIEADVREKMIEPPVKTPDLPSGMYVE